MKILSQNRQQIVNLEQTYKLTIECGDHYPRIVAVSETGIKSVLGIYLPNEAQQILEQIIASKEEIFKMPKSRRYFGGVPVTETNIKDIAENFVPSKHSLDRMVERGLFSKIPPKDELMDTLKRYIINNISAFWSNDNSAYIAVDTKHYFVVQYVYTMKQYSILTYIEISNGKTVFDMKKELSAQTRKV